MGSLGTDAEVAHGGRLTPSVLVVFDYDCSLVNDDSDALFCRTLCPELLVHLNSLPPHTPPPNGWPTLMDEIFGIFFEGNRHVQPEDVARLEAGIAVFPEMLDAVRLAMDDYRATVAIVSDANTVFIESMLGHHKLLDRVTEIHTNRGRWEERSKGRGPRLRVDPYHPPHKEPHGCVTCPANMCKGRVLEELRAKNQYDAVLYVGDGIGDFCPSTRLTSRDTVFARADGADGKSFGLLHRIKAEPHKVVARVVEWESGQDIYTHFQATLKALVSGVMDA